MSDRIYAATHKGLVLIGRQRAGKGRWQVQHTDFIGEPVTMSLSDPKTGALYAVRFA